jgi:hypothetical protein
VDLRGRRPRERPAGAGGDSPGRAPPRLPRVWGPGLRLDPGRNVRARGAPGQPGNGRRPCRCPRRPRSGNLAPPRAHDARGTVRTRELSRSGSARGRRRC